MPSSAVNQAPGGCNCDDDSDCYAYYYTLTIADQAEVCNHTTYIGDPPGGPITGCYPLVGTCGFVKIVDGVPRVVGWAGEVCYEAGTAVSGTLWGYYYYPDGPTFPDSTHVCFPDLSQGSQSVCVVGCDGDSLPGATVVASSDDPSGPFVAPALIDPDNPDGIPATTGPDGCFTFEVPAGLGAEADVVVTVNAPPEYQATTTTIKFKDLAGHGPFTPDPAVGFTCCDMAFRKGPINPGGAPYTPRGITLSFTTSGAVDPDEAWEVDVDCDGTACSLSDSLPVTGGPPTVQLCDSAEMTWDYWQPPTLTAGRVPMMVRVWYDGTDWHCSVTVYYTVARPPRPDLGGCDGDPTQDIADFYGWLRSDADCADDADPKLSVPPDPALSYPIGVSPDGGSWYSGSTTTITVANSSYTVNTNNPVDITFHFDPVTIAVHGGNVAVSIVESITVWQPE